MNKHIKAFIFLLTFSAVTFSCKESYLDEVPLDRFSPENLLTNEKGYDAAVVALYQAAREEHVIGGVNFDYMNLGTDVARWGRPDSRGFNDYTLLNPQQSISRSYWDWAYKEMIRQTNLILENIDDPKLNIPAETRGNLKGQAQFFRAYTYNVLANLYGGVPLVDRQFSEPKFDFVRASREEILRFVAKDLEEAGAGLRTTGQVEDGRITKAAAYHLLTEVYISLGLETKDASFYDKSVEAATKVISGQTGNYQLMTERFGDKNRPGDVFSDLFWYNQQNRSSGNLETIWSWQFEAFTVGGGTNQGGGSSDGGNTTPRWWAPEQDRILSPNGFKNSFADSLNRGIGVNSPLNYWKYDIWKLDPNDMRNSQYNIRRDFYYNDPEDKQYFGKKIQTGYNAKGQLVTKKEDGTLTTFVLDTLRMYYPWVRKVDGRPFTDDPSTGRTANDFIRMRLGETYLLRAEAYFRKSDLANAAQDINVVRSRAKAKSITASNLSIDFILDERARELIVEEPRMRTLIRMGLLYDRVKKYNPTSAKNIQPFNNYWPIPQSIIDANTGAKIQQNPGYPQ